MLQQFLISLLTIFTAEADWLPAPGDDPLTAGGVSVRDTLPQMQLCEVKQSGAELMIDFPPGEAAATGFERFFQSETGSIRSRHQILKTTLTRTVLVRGNVAFIHLIADQPGALSFRVTLADARIEDRRQLISPAAHVWVLPFESDVATEGRSISVTGEGEALVIWCFGGDSRAETLARLGARHDPGHNPPDPAKIWAGVSASVENSP